MRFLLSFESERSQQTKFLESKQATAEEGKRLLRDSRDLERRRTDFEAEKQRFDQERSSIEEAKESALDAKTRLERERTNLIHERDGLASEREKIIAQVRDFPSRLGEMEDLRTQARALEIKNADLMATKNREVDNLSRQLDFLKVGYQLRTYLMPSRAKCNHSLHTFSLFISFSDGQNEARKYPKRAAGDASKTA